MDNRLKDYIELIAKDVVIQYNIDIENNKLLIEETQDLLIDRIKRYGKNIERMLK